MDLESINEVIKQTNVKTRKGTNVDWYSKNKVKQVFTNCDYLAPGETKNLKFVRGNRKEIYSSHINSLLREIAKDGLVSAIDISNIDGENVILDGQHRAIVYYLLGYMIPYIYWPSEELNVDLISQIRRLNTNQKNWSNKDYVHYLKEKRAKFISIFEDAKERSPSGTPSDAIISIMLEKDKKAKDVLTLDKEELDEEIDEVRIRYKRNIDRAIYFAYSMIDIFGLSKYEFLNGFYSFLLDIGVQDLSEDFLRYLDEEVEIYYKVPPQTKPEWKGYFKELYRDYLKNKET